MTRFSMGEAIFKMLVISFLDKNLIYHMWRQALQIPRHCTRVVLKNFLQVPG